MREITIDGKVYDLVPRETAKQKEEPQLICELNGVRYFLGPEAPEEMTWKEAMEWCQSLGEGYELPSRIVLLACFLNPETKQKFKEAWYWSSTEFSAGFAWYMHFNNGHQSYSNKLNYSQVRAVRRVEVIVKLSEHNK